MGWWKRFQWVHDKGCCGWVIGGRESGNQLWGKERVGFNGEREREGERVDPLCEVHCNI
ncbi:hypothetical protein HYC85_026226 [Camellia sinensis]|uniref:Uncharacterized protein n=1 Tax=Camellia sinensis TaxID=4442 RepID=A0A7J7G3K2_CAMSI|nr:hypothetical protein HYC85_026226 [Camellia sinensis]